MLSILMCSRQQGNDNSQLMRVLAELDAKARHKEKVEVFIKFDDDDELAGAMIEQIAATNFGITVRHVQTPRGIGYNALHHAYEYMYLRANPESTMFWVIADDVKIVCDSYDALLFEAYDYGCTAHPSRAFVIHQDDCFNNYPPLYPGIEANGPENWPIWTANWLYTTGGFGLTMSTDAWTSCIEAILIRHYGYDPRMLLTPTLVERIFCSDDLPGSERFDKTREENIQLIRSKRMEGTMHMLARTLYLRHLEAQGAMGNLVQMQNV